MKTTPIARISLLAALALSPVLVGCGATDEDLEAQYPNQGGVVGSSDESLNGLPPGAPVNSAADVAAADDAYARGYAAGQQAQANGGGGVSDGQTVVIGGDDTNGADYSDTDPSALTDFRTTLDPYGSWADDETYGTVWYPSQSVVGADFQPYVTAGHWVYDDEYVWVSDYEWGWAPFHYGRWIMTPRGWAWIPGRAYSGAWVSWRMGYDGYGYLGWAPLAPTWYWRGGYAYGLYSAPYAPYAYCPYGHVFEPRGPHGYVVTGPQAGQVAAHTRPYSPANPSVDPHSGANPRVGSSSLAANAARGPLPSQLGIAANNVPHSNGSNAGLARARSFASPQAAQTFGGHAPSAARAEAPRGNVPPRSSSLAPIATGPRYIGGPTTGPTRVPYSSPRNPPQSYSRPTPAPFQGGSRPMPSQPSQPSTFGQRSFDTHTFQHTQPFQNTAPNTSSSPSFQPHQSFSSPSFHSAPSAPSPTFHSAPSSPSFHSSPSFGGGGGGGFHAPSAPISHPSSHPSVGGGGGRGHR